MNIIKLFFFSFFIFFLLFCQYTNNNSIAQEMSSFSYSQDFETSDPFLYWTSKGGYEIKEKGLTKELSSSGQSSFKIDVLLEPNSYLYWKLPVDIPLAGELQFHGDIYIKNASAGKVSLGNNVSTEPCGYNGMNVIKKLEEPTQDWVTQSSNLVTSGHTSAEKMLSKYCDIT